MLGLEQIPVFAVLSAADLDAAADVAETRIFVPGAVICRRGEPGEAFYAIAGGGVSVEVSDTHGVEREFLFLRVLESHPSLHASLMDLARRLDGRGCGETWRNTGAHEQFLVLRAAAPDHAKVRRHLNRGDVVLRLREGSDPNELPLANHGHGLFDEGEIVLQTSDSGSPLKDG